MNKKNLKNMVSLFAIISMCAGLFGMLFCFPFLWSARIEDLVGAGFPFVAGSVLLGTGLITLGILHKNSEEN